MTAPLTDQQLAAEIECAIGLTQDCGGTAGVHAVRDAVLAVVQPELDRLRSGQRPANPVGDLREARLSLMAFRHALGADMGRITEVVHQIGSGTAPLATAQREAAAYRARWESTVLEAKRQHAEADRLRQHVEELQEKLLSFDDNGKCCCSFDGPGDVCLVHSPTVERLRAELAEMTRCRDAAIRQARRDDIDVEPHLDDLFADGLYEWPDQPQPDAAPASLVNTCVALIRPVLAKLTEQRDQTRAELANAQHAAFHKAADVLDDIASKQDCFDDEQSQTDAEHTRGSARALRIYADAVAAGSALPSRAICEIPHQSIEEEDACEDARLAKGAADPDEWVRCSGLHCPNSERFTKAAERGWLHGHMDTWQCPKCRTAAGSAPTTTP
jgi:hypothetical protein